MLDQLTKTECETMVATPHTLNGLYQNDRSTILSKVQELDAALKKFGVRSSEPGSQNPDEGHKTQ